MSFFVSFFSLLTGVPSLVWRLFFRLRLVLCLALVGRHPGLLVCIRCLCAQRRPDGRVQRVAGVDLCQVCARERTARNQDGRRRSGMGGGLMERGCVV